SSQQVLEHLIVEGLLGDQPLETRVLLLQRPQPPRLAQLQPAVFLLPAIEGLLADAVPPAHLRRRRAGLVLPEHPDDLLLREPAPAHPSSSGLFSPGGLSLYLDQFLGSTSGRSTDRPTGPPI